MYDVQFIGLSALRRPQGGETKAERWCRKIAVRRIKTRRRRRL